MQSKQQSLLSPKISRTATTVLMITIGFVMALGLTQVTQAQTLNVLHTLAGPEGATPDAGLTLDPAGNLYGTAYYGGLHGFGSVFELARIGSSWVVIPIYSFRGGDDGASPFGRVVFGPDGNLYGTTYAGGGSCGCGTVYKLTPPAHVSPSVFAGWTETVLYRFSDSDGNAPYGPVAFDQAGNLYGATWLGGVNDGCGLVYELTPSAGMWTQRILHNFLNNGDGCQPTSGVILDQAGNLYGVATFNIFQLVHTGNDWTFNDLAVDGDYPFGGLIFDQLGNLFGTDLLGDVNGGGRVFELSPSSNGWIFTVLYNLPGDGNAYGPVDRLAMDPTGALYGTTYAQGTNGSGSIFKLTPSGQGWTYSELYDFTGAADGAGPWGITLMPNGDLLSTTSYAGASGNGVIWEFTP